MAKSKSFFGLRRGSTRDHTFYIQDGKQITRSRVEHVKNPRSLAQMQQRMVMTTAIAAYKCMKEICDHSWEGVEYGAKSFHKFMAINTKLLHAELSNERTFFSFNPWHDNLSCSGEFQISHGTLNNRAGETFEMSINNYEPITINFIFAFIGGYRMPLTTTNLLANTGLSVEDTITFCILLSLKEEKAKLMWLRMTILDDSDVLLTPDVIEQHVKIESNAIWTIVTETTRGVIDVTLDFPSIGDTYNIYYAMILSHKDGNSWQRTTAQLQSDLIESGLTTPADALATYPVAHNYILNGK